jgi:hypothetical protein
MIYIQSSHQTSTEANILLVKAHFSIPWTLGKAVVEVEGPPMLGWESREKIRKGLLAKQLSKEKQR